MVIRCISVSLAGSYQLILRLIKCTSCPTQASRHPHPSSHAYCLVRPSPLASPSSVSPYPRSSRFPIIIPGSCVHHDFVVRRDPTGSFPQVRHCFACVPPYSPSPLAHLIPPAMSPWSPSPFSTSRTCSFRASRSTLLLRHPPLGSPPSCRPFTNPSRPPFSVLLACPLSPRPFCHLSSSPPSHLGLLGPLISPTLATLPHSAQSM
jgi:hypothetical protein